jgi:aminoglycoside phosphotransferase (APT) family kinase protein
MTRTSEGSAADSPPGLDLAALADVFRPLHPEGPLRAEVIVGGLSNLTYRVTDGSRDWVVRRPPLGHVLATAHDMGREFRVISALAPSDVPVPPAVVYVEDANIIGAPFYVMDFVPGSSYRSAANLTPLGPDRIHAITERMVDVLAALHSVNPEDVGLGDLGRPEGFLTRQVRRWKTQLDSSRHREVQGLDALAELLANQVPSSDAVAIVHGDYRLDNLIVGADDHIAAVVDWEMATLGDPLTDVGLLVVYQRLSEQGFLVGNAASAPGFLSEEEILVRYGQVSGRDLSNLGFYIALASFKLAVILEGIHLRHAQGKTVGDGFDEVGALVEPIVAAGLAALNS